MFWLKKEIARLPTLLRLTKEMSIVGLLCRFYYTAIFQFYCLPKHTTCLQKLYWAPFHWIEESTTGLCLFPFTTQYSLQSISMSLLCRFTSLKHVYGNPTPHKSSSLHADGADCVFSEFTALTSGNTFIQLHGHGLNPAVLYPAVDILPILVSCRTILSKH